MSGRLLRLACAVTVATAAFTAQAVLAPGAAVAAPEPDVAVAVPEPDVAVAAPEPDVAVAVPEPDAAVAVPEPDAAVAAPEPGRRPMAELLTDLQRLYREAEQATEAYNATEEKLRQRQAETGHLDADLAKARLSLHESRGAAGRLARQQYQGSTGLSPYVRLLLARDPQHALDQGHLIGQLARERAETVGRLEGSERKADGLARKARAALDDQLTLTERKRRERDDVRRRLDDVERLLASLTAGQLAALAALERAGVAEDQKQLLASGALGGEHTPTEEGDRALRYAEQQLGKPYEWGAEGPSSYDCSGLTSEAWGHAGSPIPRTSQEQWARLPKVPLKELRPGDLVVYFPDASHVAMYAGDGKVVQAPRPGEQIKLSPIASNPILGAVRPDDPLRGARGRDMTPPHPDGDQAPATSAR
ncbi:NlpC/P60 family protein [Streptomyces sp. NBC_01275]|uniref:C40 family peptidase n=1 Tax=Streptomyces sp. NBC_01275 TaxID=2903807 RepID=UPI002254ADB9|nr:NlpC/P60 family protein [Streptomyces sp. NBC_01275]MCX4764943.1 NlpC/P60 family protein [Streptomyces sp. NBC_01275]